MKKELIVLLNGALSSGKTSIAMELKKQNEIPFHHLSYDDFSGNYNDFINKHIQALNLQEYWMMKLSQRSFLIPSTH